MEFGICIPHYGKPVDVSQTLEAARRAEELGFESVWVTDHLLIPKDFEIIYREHMLDPIALLGHLAAVTQRVRIGTSVIILPYRSPVAVAKMMATIDQLSGGRLIFGAAPGWLEEEFIALGLPYKERGAMTDEYLRLIRRLWTEERVSFAGKYVRFDDMVPSPRPVQRPAPPIWIGGASRWSLRRAAALGDGWHGMALAPENFAKERDALLALWEEHGRTGVPALSMRLKLFIEGVSKEVLSFPTRGILALKGGVQEVVDAMGAYQEAGMDHLIFDMSTQAHENILATMETFASEVRPKIS